jgi:hypothetical protein
MTDFGFGDFEITMLTEDFEPEPYNDKDIEQYTAHESDYLAKRRVIITYTDETEYIVKRALGVEEIKKVVYDAKELQE